MRRGDILAGVGGLALIVSLFLPWYGLQAPEGVNLGVFADVTASAWKIFSFTDVLLLLLGLVALAVPVVVALASGPAKPIAIEVVASVTGGLAVLLVVYKLINPPGPNDTIGLRYGAWIALVAAIVAWVGAWLAMRDESTPGAEPPEMPRRPAPPAHAS